MKKILYVSLMCLSAHLVAMEGEKQATDLPPTDTVIVPGALPPTEDFVTKMRTALTEFEEGRKKLAAEEESHVIKAGMGFKESINTLYTCKRAALQSKNRLHSTLRETLAQALTIINLHETELAAQIQDMDATIKALRPETPNKQLQALPPTGAARTGWLPWSSTKA